MSTLVISFSSMAWCIQIFAIRDIRGHIFICEMFGWSSHWIKPIICHCTYFCWPGNYDITYQTVHQSIFISPKNNIMMIFSLCWYDLWKIALFISFRSLCLALHQLKLDESTTRQPLKSPRSLSGRSIHLTLVTKWSWSWSWSWMTYCHPFCAMLIGPPILRYTYLKNLTMKIHGQGHVCGQRSSRLTFKIQRSRLWSRSNPLVTSEAWSSIDMFAIRFVAIRPFLAEM